MKREDWITVFALFALLFSFCAAVASWWPP